MQPLLDRNKCFEAPGWPVIRAGTNKNLHATEALRAQLDAIKKQFWASNQHPLAGDVLISLEMTNLGKKAQFLE